MGDPPPYRPASYRLGPDCDSRDQRAENTPGVAGMTRGELVIHDIGWAVLILKAAIGRMAGTSVDNPLSNEQWRVWDAEMMGIIDRLNEMRKGLE